MTEDRQRTPSTEKVMPDLEAMSDPEDYGETSEVGHSPGRRRAYSGRVTESHFIINDADVVDEFDNEDTDAFMRPIVRDLHEHINMLRAERHRAQLWDDNTCRGRVKRALYAVWRLLRAFEGVFTVCVVVLITAITQTAVLAQTWNVDQAFFSSVMAGVFSWTVLKVMDLITKSFAVKKTVVVEYDKNGPRAKVAKTLNDTHELTIVHYVVLVATLTCCVYGFILLRATCSDSMAKKEECNFVDDLVREVRQFFNQAHEKST